MQTPQKALYYSKSINKDTVHSNIQFPIINVSAVIITFNEEENIKRTLKSLWWCNEIVIVDSGSTDKTVSICKEFGCDVYFKSFNGFGKQKQYAVSKAKNDWVLCIDADEVLTEPLVLEILTILSGKINYSGFVISRNLVFLNKIFKYGKEANDSVIRLFNRKNGAWDDAIVHEKIIINGNVHTLSGKILHYSYNNSEQIFNKLNLYASLGAKKLCDKKQNKSRVIIVLAIPFNFFKYYILNRNILNGYYGFIWALLNTYYHFIKYVKHDEMKRSFFHSKAIHPSPKPTF